MYVTNTTQNVLKEGLSLCATGFCARVQGLFPLRKLPYIIAFVCFVLCCILNGCTVVVVKACTCCVNGLVVDVSNICSPCCTNMNIINA